MNQPQAITDQPTVLKSDPHPALEAIERELELFNPENVRYMMRVGGLVDWLKARREKIVAALSRPAAPVWRTDSDTPKDRPFLVALQDPDGSIDYHVARWKGAERSILVIGSMFAFDHGGKTIGWREFDLIEGDVPAELKS
jgi:hypothetical protein